MPKLDTFLLGLEGLSYGSLDYNLLSNFLLDGRGSSSYTTHDVSTPTTVVASAYGTQGNGGRKLVRLSNGWLIALTNDSGTTDHIYKSTDNGTNWSQLCTINSAAELGAMTSYNNSVYILYRGDSTSKVYSLAIDCAAVSDSDQSGSKVEVDSQTALGTGYSISSDSSGVLHAVWCSQNATYPDSYNIRYSKSTDSGANWAAPTQVTTSNTAGTNNIMPSIVIDTSNNPHVIHVLSANSDTTYFILTQNYSVSWTQVVVFSPGDYVQNYPSAVVDSSGNIHVAWNGKSASETNSFGIKYSKSTNDGANWEAATSIVAGSNSSDLNQLQPSITADSSNNVYVVWLGISTSSVYQIRKIVYIGSWGSVTELTTAATASTYPGTLSNYTSFTDPLCIYKDQNATVKFRGIWTT